MKCTVIGVMKTHMDKHSLPICNENMPLLLEDLCRFSGSEAGICYMKDKYFDSYVTDPVKSLNRFNQVVSTGHHSIAGHAQISVLFEGISKILAMYLNNLTDYETSEKSGRYTSMVGNSSKEIELYDKWYNLLVSHISCIYTDKIGSDTIDKLAKENARNFLSIFTPSTTIGYTTSLRQWNYIIDWAENFILYDLVSNPFMTSLRNEFISLVESIKPLLYVSGLRDTKGRIGFDLIDFGSSSSVSSDEFLGTNYCVTYMSSFVALAQAQRHRTLHYKCYFDGNASSFIVPDIILGSPLESVWLEDMRIVSAYCVPQGCLVLVKESGKLDDFYLKVMERNCGRAQLEIMQQTLSTSQKFIDNISAFNSSDQLLIKQFMTSSHTPKMKCELLQCKEPCVWGPVGGKLRKI